MPTRPAQPRTRPHGFTLVELLITVAVLAAGLGVLVLVTDSLRAQNAEQRTRTALSTLRTALTQYHREHDCWPAGPEHLALATLVADPASAPLMRELSGWGHDGLGRSVVLDGYGQPFVYLPPAGEDGQADFASVGADGRLGDAGPAAEQRRSATADNLYGSDLETPSP